MCLLWYKRKGLSPPLLRKKGRSKQGMEEGNPYILFSLVSHRNNEYVSKSPKDVVEKGILENEICSYICIM